MLRKRHLRLERLEVRDTPAAYTLSWIDPQHMAVNLVQNATVVTTATADVVNHATVSGLSASAVELAVAQSLSAQSVVTVDLLMTSLNSPPPGSTTPTTTTTPVTTVVIGIQLSNPLTTTPPAGTAPTTNPFQYYQFNPNSLAWMNPIL